MTEPLATADDYPSPPRAETDTSDWIDRPMSAEELQELEAALSAQQGQVAVDNLRRFARHTASRQAEIPVNYVIPGLGNPYAPRSWQNNLLALSVDERLDFEEVEPYDDAPVGLGLSIHDHAPSQEELREALHKSQNIPAFARNAYTDGIIPYVEVPAGNPDTLVLGHMNLNDGTRSRFLIPPSTQPAPNMP